MPRLLRYAIWTMVFLAGLIVLGLAAFRLSPWPAVLVLRHSFDSEAQHAMQALEPLLPDGLQEKRDIPYLAGDDDALLDVILPPGPVPPGGWPVVVWVHGGAWVSGSKENVGNYLRLLAGRGVAMVNVDYTLAPSARHPVPARQVNAALAWLAAHAGDEGLDARRVVLAGDSAGAQIAAQTAIAQLDPAYAAALGLEPALPAGSLRGLVLFCGGYDPAALNLEGPFGGFLKTVFWAYFGTRDVLNAPDLPLFSIPANLPDDMPPLFISAGNADPLGPQSVALAETAAARGIEVDALFFPPDHQPPLAHEYQFSLETQAGQQALERTHAFLERVFSPPAAP